MRYSFEPLPEGDEQDARKLTEYLSRALSDVSSAVNGLYDGEIEVATTAPPKPREGMLRYADGVAWDPASVGAGFVVFDGSTWVPVFTALDADLIAIAALGFTTTAFLKKTGVNTWALDTSTYSLSSHTHAGVYEPVITAGTTAQYWRGDKSWQTLNATAVGLGNVTNNAQWHAGNDGAASGLDADLLDGQHGSYYLAAGSYTAADVLAKLLTVDGVGSGLDADLLDGNSSAAFATAGHNHAGTYEPVLSAGTSAQYYRGDKTWQTLNATAVGLGSVTNNAQWHAGNDGSGSGLDSDLIDGYHASEAATGSTVVARNASGYVFAVIYNMTYGDEATGAASYAFLSEAAGGAAYIRRKSLANVKTEIVTSASVIAGLGYTPAGMTNSTWTPTIASITGALTSYTINYARREQHGNYTFFLIDFTITDNGTGATGLTATLGATPSYPTRAYGNNESSGYMLQGRAGASGGTLNIFAYDNTYPYLVGLGGSQRIVIRGFFEV